MTFRLVGTMALVLLLSLAAFGALMHRHQGMVMAELTQTVADVGRLTLKSFDWIQNETEESAGEAGDAKGTKVERFMTIHTRTPSESEEDDHRVLVVTRNFEQVSDTSEENVFIDIDEIRAEPGPDLVELRIPRAGGTSFAFATTDESGSTKTMLRKLEEGEEHHATQAGVHDDIVLPVPTRDYHDLYASTQTTTLLTFLGVFVIGTAVSASLAARFTRPIRRLDGAIHRLSEGDLDVQVPVERNDEIGRLAQAFNEMAARLKTSRSRERELVRREKLSSLGRLAAGVAHDVRNPLHSIGLTLQNLQETGRPEDESRRNEFDRSLNVIREEIRRLDGLVENFLRFARSEERPRVEVDVEALLVETAQLVAREAERRNVRIQVTAAEGLPSLSADAESLRSAILNLVLNGFEAMPEGGDLALAASPSSQGVCVEVRDTGRGIDPEEQEQVFDFAYTTREDGSGLGLAMVHHVVVEGHGGRVSLESTPGQGTRVVIDLPVSGRGES